MEDMNTVDQSSPQLTIKSDPDDCLENVSVSFQASAVVPPEPTSADLLTAIKVEQFTSTDMTEERPLTESFTRISEESDRHDILGSHKTLNYLYSHRNESTGTSAVPVEGQKSSSEAGRYYFEGSEEGYCVSVGSFFEGAAGASSACRRESYHESALASVQAGVSSAITDEQVSDTNISHGRDEAPSPCCKEQLSKTLRQGFDPSRKSHDKSATLGSPTRRSCRKVGKPRSVSKFIPCKGHHVATLADQRMAMNSTSDQCFSVYGNVTESVCDGSENMKEEMNKFVPGESPIHEHCALALTEHDYSVETKQEPIGAREETLQPGLGDHESPMREMSSNLSQTVESDSKKGSKEHVEQTVDYDICLPGITPKKRGRPRKSNTATGTHLISKSKLKKIKSNLAVKPRGRPRKQNSKSKTNVKHQRAKCKYQSGGDSNPEAHETKHETTDKAMSKFRSCDHCGKIFSDRSTLVRHIRIHTGEKPYSCSTCGAKFSDSSTRNQHVRRHTGQKPYKCALCNKAFAGSNDLKKHERIHTGEKRYLCDVCGKGFTTSVNLHGHQHVHLKVKAFPCQMCPKSFATAIRLQRHSHIHTGERPFKCGICGSDFRQPAQLYNHRKQHLKTEVSETKPFVCPICSRACKTEFHLTSHMNVHSGQRPFQCTSCDKRFQRLLELENHFIVHTGSKDHVCEVCGTGFAYYGSLSAHQKSHMDQKEFSCRICEHKFSGRASLREHMLKTHNRDKLFHCDICDKGFTNVFKMDRHRRIHTGKKEFECAVCGKSFIQRVSLDIHMRLHSGEKPYKCSVCEKQFTQSPNWKTHLVRQHGFDRESLKKKNQCKIFGTDCESKPE